MHEDTNDGHQKQKHLEIKMMDIERGGNARISDDGQGQVWKYINIKMIDMINRGKRYISPRPGAPNLTLSDLIRLEGPRYRNYSPAVTNIPCQGPPYKGEGISPSSVSFYAYIPGQVGEIGSLNIFRLNYCIRLGTEEGHYNISTYKNYSFTVQ